MSVRGRRSARSGRAPLPSPGRPQVAGRDRQSRFWRGIAAGLSSEDAALEAGISQPVGTRLFRKAGGMPPALFRFSAKPLSRRYLALAEREEIALLKVQGHSMREIGRRLGRPASTISRELRRNAATRSGGLEYRATTAQWHADRSACRPKRTKLALNKTLRTYVEERLAGVVVAPSGAPQAPAPIFAGATPSQSPGLQSLSSFRPFVDPKIQAPPIFMPQTKPIDLSGLRAALAARAPIFANSQG